MDMKLPKLIVTAAPLESKLPPIEVKVIIPRDYIHTLREGLNSDLNDVWVSLRPPTEELLSLIKFALKAYDNV